MDEQLIVLTNTQLESYAKRYYQKGYAKGKEDLKEYLDEQIQEIKLLKQQWMVKTR